MLVPVEDFFEGGHSICRNRILQKMFIVFGRGERLGSGADIIRQGWRENGWPEPELHEHFGANTDRVELTLRLGTVSVQNPESKVRTKDKIKKAMSGNKYITLQEIADMLNLSTGAIEKATRRMRKTGEIKHDESNKGGEWRVLK